MKRILAPLALLTLIACGGSDGSTAPTAPSLTAVSAQTYSGRYFGEPIPITVMVKSSAGAALAGASVSFSASHDGYVFPSSPVTTDSEGMARIDWHLGSVTATETLTASVSGAPDLTFS